MSVILRNDYGAIAVNKSVIEKMIIEDMLSLSDSVLLCNKKGKVIKEKPTPFIDPDYYDAVDISDKKGHFRVIIYVILNEGVSASSAAEDVFRMIESDFEMLRLEKPDFISLKTRGVMSGGEVVRKSVEVVRNNV